MVLDDSHLILCSINLAGLDGVALPDRRVSFFSVYTPDNFIVDGFGVVRNEVVVYTDDNGHAEVALVRGAIVDVAISGTGIVRRITVPTTGDSFDLLSAIASADDQFQIQTPDIPAAVRRS